MISSALYVNPVLTAPSSFYGSSGVGGGVHHSKEKDNLEKMFENYRSKEAQAKYLGYLELIWPLYTGSSDEADTVTIEGTMSYLKDLQLDIESAEVLIPLEIIQAPALGEMSRSGFVEGWKSVGYVCL